jgi:hypothetical protein
MNLIPTKLIIKVSEGKRRLRLFVSVLLAVGVYTYLLVDDYILRDEEIFVEFPLVGVAVYLVTYFLVTLTYWVVEGFEKEKKEKKEKKEVMSSFGEAGVMRRDAGSLASSFIRNVGNNFDRYCSRKGYSNIFQHSGPFFAWSILWLAICKASKPDDVLRGIVIDSLNKVLKVNHDHTMKCVDGYLKEQSGAEAMGFEEYGRLIGLDMARMFKETYEVFVQRLEEGINISLVRVRADEKNKFVPILDILMSRNSTTGAVSEFDNMSDDEFEYVFLEQCVDGFTKAQNTAFSILQESRAQCSRSA